LHAIGVEKNDGALFRPVAFRAPLPDFGVGFPCADFAAIIELRVVRRDDAAKLTSMSARLLNEKILVERPWQAESDPRAAFLICLGFGIIVDVEQRKVRRSP
jgi:hypothetical protein